MHQHHSPHNYNRAFVLGVTLNTIYVVVEAGTGLWINSLPLLSDAGHNLGDVFSLLLAWISHAISRLPATSRRTYGYRSTTILASLINGLLLIAIAGGIFWESFHRFGQPVNEHNTTVIQVACLGIVINTLTAWMFLSDRHHDLNIRGAYLHMAADAAVSVGVVVAAGVSLLTGWSWPDPAISIVIAILIFINSWDLVVESLQLTLQAAPRNIPVDQIVDAILADETVESVHDVHVWGMSTTEVALTAHIIRPQHSDHDEFLSHWSRKLRHDYGIGHITIQIEQNLKLSGCDQAQTCFVAPHENHDHDHDHTGHDHDS